MQASMAGKLRHSLLPYSAIGLLTVGSFSRSKSPIAVLLPLHRRYWKNGTHNLSPFMHMCRASHSHDLMITVADTKPNTEPNMSSILQMHILFKQSREQPTAVCHGL